MSGPIFSARRQPSARQRTRPCPRPRARRLLAPIASLAACAGAAAALVAVTATVGAPAASAAVTRPDAHRSHTVFPTLPISSVSLPFGGPTATAPTGGGTTQPPTTSAPAPSQSSSTPADTATASSGDGGNFQPTKTSTFVPQSLPAQPAPSSAGPCVPDTQAPKSGADLQLPQVNAGSTDPGYTGWLRVAAVGPQAMLPTRIDGTDLSTLTLTRTEDAESADLAMAASSGDRFACARLDVAAGPGFQRADYALTDAGFVSETVKGRTETLIVTYASISWNYIATGASKPTTGSGAINTQPSVAQTSLKRDAQLVGAGVLALALVCLLGMLLLTLIGRHRRRARYRRVRELSRRQVVASAATVPELVTAGAPAREASAPDPAEEQVEFAVPETLRAVHVAEFVHPRPAEPAAKADAEVAPPEPAEERPSAKAAELPAAVDAQTEAHADDDADHGLAAADSDADDAASADEEASDEEHPDDESPDEEPADGEAGAANASEAD